MPCNWQSVSNFLIPILLEYILCTLTYFFFKLDRFITLIAAYYDVVKSQYIDRYRSSIFCSSFLLPPLPYPRTVLILLLKFLFLFFLLQILIFLPLFFVFLSSLFFSSETLLSQPVIRPHFSALSLQHNKSVSFYRNLSDRYISR